jgi:hypothetical protein
MGLSAVFYSVRAVFLVILKIDHMVLSCPSPQKIVPRSRSLGTLIGGHSLPARGIVGLWVT